jgi:taurine transport system permease protein
VRGIESNLFRAAQSTGASPLEIFTSIVLPGSPPQQIFTGVRLAWGISLIAIIAAEMIGASVGIGYMVLEAQQTFRTERVFAGIIVIELFGFLTDLGFRRLRRPFRPWYS